MSDLTSPAEVIRRNRAMLGLETTEENITFALMAARFTTKEIVEMLVTPPRGKPQ